MKLKLWITTILLGFIVIYMIASELFLLSDIFFLYLLVLIPTIFFVTIEFLVKKKIPFKDFIKGKIFGHLLTVIFCLCFFIFWVSGKSILKKTAINDLNFMIESLENIHPDIYHLISKDSFLIEMNNEIDNLPEKVSEVEFFKVCARLTSHFRTGHTTPMRNLSESKFPFRRLFPFETKFINDKLFVIKNLTILNSIPIGSEIIEINNKSINQVINEWSKLVSYENLAYRNRQITMPVNISIWNDFNSFKIKYIDYKSKTIKTKRVSGSVCSNIYHFLKSKHEKPQELFYKELTPDIGYIGFFSCMDLENYENFYKSTFNELKNKGIKHLIIDIRDNGGGHTIITAWLEHIFFINPIEKKIQQL